VFRGTTLHLDFTFAPVTNLPAGVANLPPAILKFALPVLHCWLLALHRPSSPCASSTADTRNQKNQSQKYLKTLVWGTKWGGTHQAVSSTSFVTLTQCHQCCWVIGDEPNALSLQSHMISHITSI